MKLYVEEPGSTTVRGQIDEATVMTTSSITYVEARAALARRRRADHISAADHQRLVAMWDSDWERYVRLDITDGLLREAAALSDRHPLRAYDAIHLASALTARRQFEGNLLFTCWDDGLSAAARREGLDVARR